MTICLISAVSILFKGEYILGALGILWAWLLAILGWTLGGVGLALALLGRNKNKFEKTCKTGLILSAVALGCSFISSLLGMLLMM